MRIRGVAVCCALALSFPALALSAPATANELAEAEQRVVATERPLGIAPGAQDLGALRCYLMHFRQAGQKELAVAECDKILVRFGDDREVLLATTTTKAQLLVELGLLEDAVASLERLYDRFSSERSMEKAPRDQLVPVAGNVCASITTNIGMLYEAAGRFAEAARVYDRLRRWDAEGPPAVREWMVRFRAEKGEQEWERTWGEQRDVWYALPVVGALRKARQFRAAIAESQHVLSALDRLVGENPAPERARMLRWTRISLLLGMAECQEGIEQWGDAVDLYRLILKHLSGDDAVTLYVGTPPDGKGFPEDAAWSMVRLTSHRRILVPMALGRSLLASGDKRGARERLEAVRAAFQDRGLFPPGKPRAGYGDDLVRIRDVELPKALAAVGEGGA